MSHINKIRKLAYASYEVSRLILILLKSRHMPIIFSFNLKFRKWYRWFLTGLDTFYFITIALLAWKKKEQRSHSYLCLHTL